MLHGIDLVVPAGSILAVLGPNGAGKTTMLKVISGALRPTAGSVLMEGHDVTGASADRVARAGLCLIPEGRGIFPNLSVSENILMDTFSTTGPLHQRSRGGRLRPLPAARRTPPSAGRHPVGRRAADAARSAARSPPTPP